MEVATENLVIYDDNEQLIIAEVFLSDKYKTPSNVSIYKGNLEDFRSEFPNYKLKE